MWRCTYKIMIFVCACIFLASCKFPPLLYREEEQTFSPYLCQQRIYAYGATVASIIVLLCTPEVTQAHDTMYYHRTGYMYMGQHPDAFVCMMPYSATSYIQTDHRPGTWSVVLDNGTYVPAAHTYQTWLDPEYRYIINAEYLRLYDVYAVTFHERPQPSCTIWVQSPAWRMCCPFHA